VVGAEALISILVDDAPSLGVGHSTAVRQLCWHAAVAILGALRGVDHGVERYRFRVGDGGPVVVSLARRSVPAARRLSFDRSYRAERRRSLEIRVGSSHAGGEFGLADAQPRIAPALLGFAGG
jgi:hypothetical protein